MNHAHLKSDEKFGTTMSHQGQSLREQEDLDISGSRDRYSTPNKQKKFVISHFGILSTSEQVNGSFRRISGVGKEFEPLQQSVAPSKQYFDTPDFSFADRRNMDIEKQFYQARQINNQTRGNKVNERLYAKAKFVSSPYERLVAPLRISSMASTKDSQEAQGKYRQKLVADVNEMMPLASSNTLASMTVHQERIQKVSANLCYCVPEFNNLDVAGLPDTNELLSAL